MKMTDPKVFISILALVISIASIVWSLLNQNEQNRRWSELNRANITLKDVKMGKIKEMTREEATNTNWGYTPRLYSTEEIDKVQLPYYLICHYTGTNNKIEGINPVFTYAAINKELSRIDFKGKVDVNMMFHPFFTFENVGKTDAKDFKTEIFIKTNITGNWLISTKTNNSIQLTPSQVYSYQLNFDYPSFQQFPEFLSFKIILTYIDVNAESIYKEIILTWYAKNNAWNFGEFNESKTLQYQHDFSNQ